RSSKGDGATETCSTSPISVISASISSWCASPVEPSSVTNTTCPEVPPVSGKRVAGASMPRRPSGPGSSVSEAKLPPGPTAGRRTTTSRTTEAPTSLQRSEAIRRPKRYRDEDTGPPGRARADDVGPPARDVHAFDTRMYRWDTIGTSPPATTPDGAVRPGAPCVRPDEEP